MIYILWHWYDLNGVLTRFELEEFSGPPELLGQRVRTQTTSHETSQLNSKNKERLICAQVISFQK